MHPFTLGLTTGLMLIVPFLRVADVPVAYVLTLVFFVYQITLRKGIKYQGKRIIVFFWTIVYVMWVGLIFQKVDAVHVTFLNLIFLISALNILNAIPSRRTFGYFCVGLGVVSGMNSLLAVMQHFDLYGARLLSLAFLKLNGVSEVVEPLIGGESLRVFGLQAASHIFAHTSSVLAAFFILSLLVVAPERRNTRALLLVVSILLVYSVFLTGQRSAVWPLSLPIGYVCYTALVRSHGVSFKVFASIAGLLFAAFIMSSSENLNNILSSRVFEGVGKTSADITRGSSWAAGVDMISDDPWFGSSYNSDRLTIGIHNAFLSGWARLGFFWLVFFLSALIFFIFSSFYRRNSKQSLAAFSILFIVFSNMMFHSSVPTLNDLAFYIALAMLVGLQKFLGDKYVR